MLGADYGRINSGLQLNRERLYASYIETSPVILQLFPYNGCIFPWTLSTIEILPI